MTLAFGRVGSAFRPVLKDWGIKSRIVLRLRQVDHRLLEAHQGGGPELHREIG